MNDFACRHESKLLARSGHFEITGFRCIEQNDRFKIPESTQNRILPIETLMKEIKHVFTEKFEIDYRDNSLWIALSGYNSKIKIPIYRPKSNILKIRSPAETCDKDLDGKRDFSKPMAFFRITEISWLTQGRKQMIFRWNTIVQVEGFRLRPGWKNWTVFIWKKWVATFKNFNSICAFWRFLNLRILERYVRADRFSKIFCIFLIPERLE